MDIQKYVLMSQSRHQELLLEAREQRCPRHLARVSAASRVIAWLYNQFAKPELERAGELHPATV
jgi:hypothetical protein